MQRYHIRASGEFGTDAWPEYIKGKTGAWVKYEESQAKIARLLAEVDFWKGAVATANHQRDAANNRAATARNDALEGAAHLIDNIHQKYKSLGEFTHCNALDEAEHAIRSMKTGDK